MIRYEPQRSVIPSQKCKCHIPPLYHGDYEISFAGTDTTNGRFAEITIEICRHCGAKWLRYLVEFESVPCSARWYRGIIPDQFPEPVSPEQVVSCIEGLDWYLFGGSYFSSPGMYGNGKMRIDL